ncbi:MAG: FemAB family PEP-CTERM system-associated protein [Magnetospirillum sp.]|nr:FemAB family PEP-CTERM system-associated protein [Magnetospirillum sp.]
MIDTVKTLDAQSRPRWESYVLAHPQATFFHRAGWQQVTEESFGHDTYYLYAERDGRVRGVLPLAHYRSRLFGNRLIANGNCVAGAPVADDERAYRALDQAAEALMERLGAQSLEYRQPIHRHPEWTVNDSLYANFAGPVDPDAEAHFKRIPRRQRAVLRKALAAGLTDEIDDGVERLYPLYALSVRNLGTPVFAKRYFRTLKEVFGADCEVMTASHGRTPLGSVLSFTFRDRIMPYYIGGSGAAREMGGTDFLMWRLMRRGVERGFPVFDFGRSKVGTGPYHFKRHWGFTPEPIVHEYRTRNGAPAPEINPLNPKYRLAIALWQRLPLAVANLLGPHIVRNIG